MGSGCGGFITLAFIYEPPFVFLPSPSSAGYSIPFILNSIEI
jgi:hypothetical protein